MVSLILIPTILFIIIILIIYIQTEYMNEIRMILKKIFISPKNQKTTQRISKSTSIFEKNNNFNLEQKTYPKINSKINSKDFNFKHSHFSPNELCNIFKEEQKYDLNSINLQNSTQIIPDPNFIISRTKLIQNKKQNINKINEEKIDRNLNDSLKTFWDNKLPSSNNNLINYSYNPSILPTIIIPKTPKIQEEEQQPLINKEEPIKSKFSLGGSGFNLPKPPSTNTTEISKTPSLGGISLSKPNNDFKFSLPSLKK